MSQLPQWRDFEPNSVSAEGTWSVIDVLVEDYRLLSDPVGLLVDDARPEWANPEEGDMERMLLPTRLEWALMLAAYSAYEAELMRLAFQVPPVDPKYALTAINRLRSKIRGVISDFEDLKQFAEQLKDLRNVLAHGGGTPGFMDTNGTFSATKYAGVQYFLGSGRLVVRDDNYSLYLAFARGEFNKFAGELKQILLIARTASRQDV